MKARAIAQNKAFEESLKKKDDSVKEQLRIARAARLTPEERAWIGLRLPKGYYGELDPPTLPGVWSRQRS